MKKAYKELEQDGLITIKHDDGCFISLQKARAQDGKTLNIVTTGFRVNEIRKAIGDT